MDSDEDWLDDAPAAHPGAHGDPLVDRQWERITTRYADVSPVRSAPTSRAELDFVMVL